MGNDSINLVFDEDLTRYKGAILSPVNCTKEETIGHVTRMRELQDFDVIFDPQLYLPRSARGCLPSWDYFPRDVDTVDLSDSSWWRTAVDNLLASMGAVRPDAVCSPAMVPRAFPDSFYEQLVSVSDYLTRGLANTSTRSIMTVIVRMQDLSEPGRALVIASILSRAETEDIYLVFLSEKEPRREYTEAEEIKGAMKLIASLEGAGMHVLVGFCSSDIVLWKSVGASACATGKFFNIRRFTLSRFDEPSSGGGQVPYWFEEAILAFVRQTDLLRLQQRGVISESSQRNPFGARAIEAFTANRPWIALSWRQYMWWFADIEQRLRVGTADGRNLVEIADRNWGELERAPRVYMEERANDGSWIRSWLRAFEELSSFI
jgi:hypothetical protein